MRSIRLSTYVETRPGNAAMRRGCRDRTRTRQAAAVVALPIVLGLPV